MEPTLRAKKSTEMLANRFKKAYKGHHPQIEIEYPDPLSGEVTVTFSTRIDELEWEELLDKAREVAEWDDTPYYSDLQVDCDPSYDCEPYFTWGIKVAKTVSVYK